MNTDVLAAPSEDKAFEFQAWVAEVDQQAELKAGGQPATRQ
jgi:hypothetical protein